MDDDRAHLGADPLPVGADEANESLRRLGDAKVGPGGKVKVLDRAHGVAAHHPELGNVPVGKVGLVENRHLDVAVVDGLGVVGPVVVALFATLLDAPEFVKCCTLVTDNFHFGRWLFNNLSCAFLRCIVGGNLKNPIQT